MELLVVVCLIWIAIAMLRLAIQCIVPIACIVGLCMIVGSCSERTRAAPAMETVR